MAGSWRRVLPRAVASALGLVVAAAIVTVVAHSVAGRADPHPLRAVIPAAAAAPVTSQALPSRLPDLAGAAAAPAGEPALTGRLRIGTGPVVAPLAPQDRRGHADRGPPAAAPRS